MSNTPDKRTRDILKEYFETGDRPKEIEFIRLIDSGINQKDDELFAVNGKIGVGTNDPQSKLHVSGQTFVSKPGGVNVPRTGNMLEVNAHNQNAVAIVTKSNDVLNFVDDGATINSNPFTITDNSGRGFRFYKNAGDLATDGEKLRIQPNGYVGIGTNNPQSKLHVSGQTFVSNPGGANVPRTGNMLEVNADNQSAVAIVTKSNDVLNFVDDGATINSNPFTITDNSGRGFRFYKNAGDLATDGEKLRIQPNGHVGIGTIDPKSKLHVHQNGGNTTGLRLSGQDNVNPGDILALDQGGNAKWVAPTSVTNGLWKKIGTTDHIENGNVGNVGIGTDDPQNKLEIKGTGDTGLRLPTGKGDGKILTSDSDGNAVWKPATDITNSLWQAIGTTGHIRNGNTGNVGVGTSFPQSELHLKGTFKIDSSSNDVVIFNDPNYPNGSGQNTNPFTILDQTGSRGFRFWIGPKPGKSGFNTLNISKDGDLTINKKNLYLAHDTNHGIGWFGTGKTFANTNVDGPVTFGFTGGALGSNQYGSENIALRWDQHQRVGINGLGDNTNWPFKLQVWGGDKVPVLIETKTTDAIHFHDEGQPLEVKRRGPFTFVDRTGVRGFRFFNGSTNNETLRVNSDGSVKINSVTPFIIKRYNFSSNEYIKSNISDYPPQDYEAVVGGIQFKSFGSVLYGNENFMAYIQPNYGNNTWTIEARFPNGSGDGGGKGKEKIIDILFIRNKLISRV